MNDHLSPEARAMLEAPIAKRIEMICQKRWIEYPLATTILQRFEDLLVYPKRARMPGMLLYAESHNGKTSIPEEFLAKHPRNENAGGDYAQIPALYCLAHDEPSDRMLYSELLNALGAPKSRETLRERAEAVLQACGVRMLFLDEIQNYFNGSPQKQRRMMDVIKNLSIRLQIVIVLIGTTTALNVVRSDDQIVSRFPPTHLTRWECNLEFRRLLVSFEQGYPLVEASNLGEKSTAKLIHDKTQGRIGFVSDLLERCAIEAIRIDSPKITQEIIKNILWTQPN
jgi:hypothetical protein